MADELDLESGDEARADAISAREQRRQRRQRSGSSSSKERSKPRDDGDLPSRLVRAFENIADQLDARDDDELATAVRESARPMATGLVSFTRSFTPLRGPLVLLVDLFEPVLAFWRVGSILTRRWFARRQARAAAAEQAVTPEEWAAAQAAAA